MVTAIRIDKPLLVENLLHIDNKQGIVVPFQFNYMQRYFSQNKSNRNIILKHRQGGMTSSILADMFMDCITVPHSSCVVTSHETRATQRLLDRVHFYYDTMEEPRPSVDAYSRSEITFPNMHSSIYIGTAGSRAFGRGDTIRKALISELAFYEEGERLLVGVEDAVPLSGELSIECSPNGEDNIFYERWIRAREGRSPYKPFFFPWWWCTDYQIPIESEYALPEDKGELILTGEEMELIQRVHLTEAQIRWRRWKIAEKGGLFWQEYPEDELSCFITIGDPVFDQSILNSLASGCYEGIRHPVGWTYWIPPVEGATYLIAADSAAGAPGGSYSAAVVLDEQWQVVANYQARVEPNTFSSILRELGIWYNTAMIAIERNFTGYAVLAALAGTTNVGNITTASYPNLYRQRDFLTGKVTSNLGWWTNEQTKEHMRTALRDRLPQLKLWDVNLVRQLRSYRFIKMKPTAQTFDDMAISLMIACAIKKVEGVARGYRGSVKGWDW